MKRYVYLLLNSKGETVGVYENEAIAQNIVKRAKAESDVELTLLKILFNAPFEYVKL